MHGPIEMNLLRIGQEAVANAVSHGRAGRIAVQLHYAAGFVRLTVSDDGQGFVVQSSPAGHFGLLDMRERAQSMGSNLKIDSEPGCGTRIAIEVPVPLQNPVHEELKTNTHSGS